jgi:hypothetical protein
VSKREHTSFYLKQHLDLQIYVHQKGEEFWLSTYEFPTEIVMFKLKTKNASDMIIFGATIKEKETTLLNNENNICQSYSEKQSENFVGCCKAKVEEKLKSAINCTIPGIGHLIKSKDFNEC